MRDFMDHIVGNESLKSRLCSDIIHESFSHAYIIEGPRGSGKRTIAKYAAAALNCRERCNNSRPLPCGECDACRKILEGISPDVIKVSRGENATLGVDSIRFMRSDVSTVPNDLENKIYIIEEADKMTEQAQNAFLLTLEEPPPFVGFILLCENSVSLLETIRSRAPTLRTEPLSIEDIDRYISKNDANAAQMKASAPDDYRELLMCAEGSIGKALECSSPEIFLPIKERRALVRDFVRAAINHCSSQQSLDILSRFSSTRDQVSFELSMIQTALRDLAVTKKSDSPILCFYPLHEEARELTDATSTGKIFLLMSAVSDALERISRYANLKLTLMTLLSEADMLT